MESYRLEKKPNSNTKINSILKSTTNQSKIKSKKKVSFALVPEERLIIKNPWENDENIEYIFEPDHEEIVKKMHLEKKIEGQNRVALLESIISKIENPYFSILIHTITLDDEITPVLSFDFKSGNKNNETLLKALAMQHDLYFSTSHPRLRLIYDEEKLIFFQRFFDDLYLIRNDHSFFSTSSETTYRWFIDHMGWAADYIYDQLCYYSRMIYNVNEDFPFAGSKRLKM